MFQTVIVAFIAFFLAYILALIFLRNRNRKSFPKKKSIRLDNEMARNKWQEIEQTFALGGPSHSKTSIIEADKLIDHILKAKGVSGDTFAERLKNAKPEFHSYADYNNLWFAHKVRNNIAHESTHDLNSAEAKRAIEYYKKALQELRII